MSQRIPVAPFHRRVLPWIFIIAFLAVAPAVVFYTAGYRYNSKKGKVERNGTVILDSTPSGANITVDGQLSSDKSPTTIQDMPPGIHHFELTKAGYHGWSKSLEVHSELVTFANNIWLWKDSVPTFFSSSNTLLLSASPDQSSLFELTAATPTQALVLDARGTTTATFSLPKNVTPGSRAFWAPSGRYVLIEAPAGSNGLSWLIDTRDARAPQELLPGIYRWENNQLVGTTDGAKLTINLSNFSVSSTTLPHGTVDTTTNASLQVAPGTNQLVYIETNNPSQGFILPPGDWRFWSSARAETLLRDGTHWLSLMTSTQPPEYRSVSGDMLRTFTANGSTHQLTVNGNEIWTWDTDKDPQLLYRLSDPIVNAQWHTAGYDIFFATAHEIYALNLDPRDGYLLTPLAQFDTITDFSALPKQLYIAGTKNAQTGIWTLDVQ
jgi:hypothetical protein